MNMQDKGKWLLPRLLSAPQMSPMYLEGRERHFNIREQFSPFCQCACVCVWHPGVNTTNPWAVTPVEDGCQVPKRKICPVQSCGSILKDHIVWAPVSTFCRHWCLCLLRSCIFGRPCVPCPYVLMSVCVRVCVMSVHECTSDYMLLIALQTVLISQTKG